MKNFAQKFFKTCGDALYPPRFTCDLCGREIFDGGNLCADCNKTVTKNDGVTCPVCGRKTVRPEICLECKEKVPLFRRGISGLVYEDGGAALISRFKNGHGYLKEYFADLIIEKLSDLPASDCIAFVPVTKKTLQMRGTIKAGCLQRKFQSGRKFP